MTLTVNALTTLALVNTELGLTADGGVIDARVERIIESISSQISKYCGVPSFHNETARVDKVKSYGGTKLFAPKRPVNSIASIIYDPDDSAVTVSSDNYSIDSAAKGVVYSAMGWLWTTVGRQRITFTPVAGAEQRLYQITYDCGFVTQNQKDLDALLTKTIPLDLEDAATLMAASRYLRSSRDPSIKSEKLLSWSASYGSTGSNNNAGIPDDIAGMLSNYRAVRFA